MRTAVRAGVLVVFALLGATPLAQAQGTLSAGVSAKVDAAVADVMARTGVPSASVGVVQDGRIVFTKAYGKARLDPAMPATSRMHYAIGSISKQFTVACILLLQEEGKLSIDDPIAKYFPELTRANEVTIRNILSHTSGYEDYAPQDYTIPEWTKPTTADRIIHEWATKPLDFEPGTQYQYSNTNFNIAGLIVQKVSGEPFWSFLSRRVLKPLGLADTIDLDTDHDKVEPIGYMRNALGPLRPAIIEAPGWYFADGEMAMPVGDLLTWDISLIDQSLLKPASYAAMETEFKLKNGEGAHYGLGVSLGTRDGHRVVSHGGEVGGFVAANTVFPDDRIAIAVLTNQEASPAAGSISRAISSLLLAPSAAATGPAAERARAEAQAKAVLGDLQHGKIDRSLFTADCNFYFDQVSLDDHAKSLGPLGAVQTVTQSGSSLRGGMTFRSFDVTFAGGTRVRVTTYTTKDGRLEQFLVGPVG
jgi:CubicO group peptidase (beta-lactamase class C family)